MIDLRQKMLKLIDEARALHASEYTHKRRSLEIIEEIEELNTGHALDLSQAELARRVGLTKNIFWKRLQAARVVRRFPEAWELVKNGETCIATLALLAPRITEANASLLLSGIKDRSKREVEAFASRVTPDGVLLDREGEVEIKLVLKDTDLAFLARAREVLSARGKVPTDNEILLKALRELVDRRDPLKKAKRSRATPAPASSSPGKSESVSSEETAASAQKGRPRPSAEVSSSASSPGKRNREYIPAKDRHEVWVRDGAQCTWIFEDDRRCEERTMLEFDHFPVPVCRGGKSVASNLTLRCRRHNLMGASRLLGRDFMERKVAEASSERSPP